MAIYMARKIGVKACTVTVKAQPLHSTKNRRLHETIIVVVVITYNHYSLR